MDEKPKKIERWSYPFKAKGSATGASSEVTDPQIYYEALAKAESGYYPVASNGLWHGGVHFDQNTAAMLDQSSVRCIADGVVIAYRIDEIYKTLNYTGSGTSKEVTYSTGFVLVKHRLELPPDPAAATSPAGTPPAAEPDLTFYSLYMHLMDWDSYEKDGAPKPPSFMCPIHYAVSAEGATNDFSGLFVRGGAPGTTEHGNKVAIIPKGCKVRVGEPSSIDPRWRKLVSILEGKAFPALAPEIEHWVFPGEMTPTPDGDVFLIGEKADDVRASLLPGKGLTVRKEANRHSAAMAVLPVDAQVLLEDGTGSFRKIKSIVASTLTSPLSPECAPNIAGYIHFDSLKAIPQSPTLRTVQVLETPVPIQAGALIGHLGKYQAASQSEAHDLLHLEVFSLDDVEAFVTQSRARANQLKPEQKTLLKIPTGTTVITQEGASPTDLPLPPGQPTAYDMILPLAVLNALPADKKITLTTTVSGTATTEQWWKLDNLPGEGGNPISGWVKEGELMTPRYHPWDWEGFDFIKETSTPSERYVCKLSVDGVLDDGEKTNYKAQISNIDGGPINERLYKIIDKDNDEKLTPDEIKKALEKGWHAQSISKLIAKYESEWYADRAFSKWEALNCYMTKEGEKDWEQEKERIKSLLWWTECNIETDYSGIAFHFHPLSLVSQFSKLPNRGDLFVRRGQVTFDAEGNDIPGNLYFSRRLHWPGGASGVTLGRGYDMKQRTSASVYADLIAAGVDHDSAQNFSQGAQLSGNAARDFVNSNRDAYGVISRESQRILFEDITYPRYEAAAKTRYTNGTAGEVGATPWDSLNNRVRDIAVDLTYQQGSIWDRQLPHISANNKGALAEYIRDTPELSQYEVGRKRASYLTGD